MDIHGHSALREGLLRIGWARMNITPDKPVKVQGQFYERISQYVQSPLFITVLALETIDPQGNVIDQMMAGACDLCNVTADLQQQVRLALADKLPGFDLSKLFLSATHTHTAPLSEEGIVTAGHIYRFIPEGMLPPSKAEGRDIMTAAQYKQFLIGVCGEAFRQAWESRRPGSMSRELGHAVLGHNRRVSYDDGSALMYGSSDTINYAGPEGPTDHGVELLYFWDEEGRLTGAAANIVCPSQVVEGMCILSADYWGETRRVLEREMPGGLMILPLCGAAGDQSPRDLARRGRGEPNMRQIEGAVEMGKRAAKAILDKIDAAAARKTNRVIFRHQTLSVDLPLRTVSKKQYDAAKAEFAAILSRKNPDEPLTTADIVQLHTPGGIMDRYEYQQTRSCYSPEMHFIRLGDVAIATNPFELFTQYGLQIKARARAAQTLIIQLTGDRAKYLPTQRAIDGGHYSAIVASGIVGPEGGQYLVNRTVEILNSMWP